MNILIAILLLFPPIPRETPPCYALRVHVAAYQIHIPDRQVVGDIYTTQVVSATNGLITDTVSLTRPWIVGWPPYDTHLTASTPYVAYVCRTGRVPGRAFLSIWRV